MVVRHGVSMLRLAKYFIISVSTLREHAHLQARPQAESRSSRGWPGKVRKRLERGWWLGGSGSAQHSVSVWHGLYMEGAEVAPSGSLILVDIMVLLWVPSHWCLTREWISWRSSILPPRPVRRVPWFEAIQPESARAHISNLPGYLFKKKSSWFFFSYFSPIPSSCPGVFSLVHSQNPAVLHLVCHGCV